MRSIVARRTTVDKQTGKSLYDVFVDDAAEMGDTNLACHVFGETFTRSDPDARGNIFYQKLDGTPFVVNFLAEIGSAEQGTHMAAYPQKNPPLSDLPYTSKSHKMQIGLRCPTHATPELRKMFRNGLAACDGIRNDDAMIEEAENKEWEINDWIICAKGDETNVDKMSLLVKLQQTYELPQSAPGSNDPEDVTMTVAEPAEPAVSERKVGDRYHPDRLPDHRGPYFSHEKAQLVQREYRDSDGTLIAPYELYEKLVEGTLVLVTIRLVTYIMKDLTFKDGKKKPDRKVYQNIVESLKILDAGDCYPWNPPVPTLPDRPISTPKRARDPAADAAFANFGASRSSPSPTKRRRTGQAK